MSFMVGYSRLGQSGVGVVHYMLMKFPYCHVLFYKLTPSFEVSFFCYISLFLLSMLSVNIIGIARRIKSIFAVNSCSNIQPVLCLCYCVSDLPPSLGNVNVGTNMYIHTYIHTYLQTLRDFLLICFCRLPRHRTRRFGLPS